MMKNLILGFVATLIFGVAIGYFFGYGGGVEQGKRINISSFEECKAAGYPIMESYPEQCKTPNGKYFTRLIREVPIEETDDTSELPSDIGGEGQGSRVPGEEWGVPDGPMPPETVLPSTPVMCTMDAKICPDGSAVGRTGPACEFAPCPGE